MPPPLSPSAASAVAHLPNTRVWRVRRRHWDMSSNAWASAPVVAATDYVRAYAQLIAPYVSAPFKVLGTDGFGCSDTRRALRRYFAVDSQAICLTALQALVEQGRLAADTVAKARRVMDGTDNRHA